MTERTFRLAVISAGTSDPSSTRMLADRIAQRVSGAAAERGAEVGIEVISLRELAGEIAAAMVSGAQGPGLTRAVEVLGAADAVIAATPVYKAGPSALFTGFFQILDDDLLIGTPVVLAATAGSARHALVVDDQMRALFAYLRTVTAPTSVFAAPDDWGSSELGSRIDRAAVELALLMASGFAQDLKDASWHRYQHTYGSAGGTELGIDLDTDVMRLAAGGRA